MPRKLSKEAQERLLSDMRRPLRPDQEGLAPLPAAIAGTAATAFETLPGYEAIRLQRAVAGGLGLAVPYYRTHGMRAGAVSQIDGRHLVNFTSYDYLGLNGHPDIVQAVAGAAGQWGTSVSASRLTSGERPFHAELEARLAALYDAEAALAFVSGYATNVSVIGAMMGPEDLIVHDALSHNSIVMGAEASGAHRRSFAHNDMAVLDTILETSRARFRNCLIVTEGLFSMDGDVPDLGALIAIKRRHNAWLMVDEAHSLGVLGGTGRGIAEHAALPAADVDVWMGTLSKSLVSCGGYIAGSAKLIEYLKYRAPGMLYSVGLAPPAAAAAIAAHDLMLAEPERVGRLHRLSTRFMERAIAAGLDIGSSAGFAICPVMIGDSLQTVMLADALEKQGVCAVPIIPPGVPERSARLRFFLSSMHRDADIDRTVALVASELARIRRSDLSLITLSDHVDLSAITADRS